MTERSWNLEFSNMAAAAESQETEHEQEKDRRMFLRISESGVTIKSQQRDEPDFTTEKKIEILQEIREKNPSSFLTRFGKFLHEEDLSYFKELYKSDPERNYEIDFRLKEIRKYLDSKTRHVDVQNRRYKALQRLSEDSNFFSEKEMRRRNPLLYEQYVGQYMTEEEKLERDLAEQGSDPSLSQMMFYKFDAEKTEWIYNYQKEREEEMEEEEEDDSNDDDDDDDNMHGQDASGSPIKGTPTEAEKAFLKEEFLTEMKQQFLLGKEEEFDYSTVDMNDDYDDLKIREIDEEEKYFDDDDDDVYNLDGINQSHGNQHDGSKSNVNNMDQSDGYKLDDDNVKT